MTTDTPEPARCPVHRLDPLGGSPHANNARWLAEGSTARVLMPGDVPGAVVLGHAALKEFLGSPDVSKSPAHFGEYQAGRIPAGWPLSPFALIQNMLTADGAEHQRLRSAIGKLLIRSRVRPLRPRIEELVDRLLDRLAEAAAGAPDGVVDFRELFALPFPLEVICELLGIPEEPRARLRECGSLIISTDVQPADLIAADQEMTDLLAAVVDERAGQPGSEFITELVARSLQEARLSHDELVATLKSLFIAGHETTVGLLVSAVRGLSADRGTLERVRRGDVPWSAVIDETLRWDGPVSYFPFRYPTRDIEIDGHVIEAGTAVLAGYSAAGRDPAAYGPDAQRFDVAHRGKADLLSFGHGPHYCPGEPLARLEAEVALERLYRRFPELETAVGDEELVYSHSFVGNVVVELPVRPGADHG